MDIENINSWIPININLESSIDNQTTIYNLNYIDSKFSMATSNSLKLIDNSLLIPGEIQDYKHKENNIYFCASKIYSNSSQVRNVFVIFKFFLFFVRFLDYIHILRLISQ